MRPLPVAGADQRHPAGLTPHTRITSLQIHHQQPLQHSRSPSRLPSHSCLPSCRSLCTVHLLSLRQGRMIAWFHVHAGTTWPSVSSLRHVLNPMPCRSQRRSILPPVWITPTVRPPIHLTSFCFTTSSLLFVPCTALPPLDLSLSQRSVGHVSSPPRK